MSAYTVDPDALRAASASVEQLADSVAAASTGSCVDVGHDALASAISEFEQQTSLSWSTRRQTTVAVAQGLKRTAKIFESADEDAASSAHRANPGMF
jgi:hypothetical protein